jgi:hypothetical protein
LGKIGGKRVKKIIGIIIFMLTPLFLFASAEPTAVPNISVKYTKTVKIAVVEPVENIKGAFVPKLEKNLSDLAVGTAYIYNSDRTKVCVIMNIPVENSGKVEKLLKAGKKEIKKSDESNIENEFKGYKTHMGK